MPLAKLKKKKKPVFTVTVRSILILYRHPLQILGPRLKPGRKKQQGDNRPISSYGVTCLQIVRPFRPLVNLQQRFPFPLQLP